MFVYLNFDSLLGVCPNGSIACDSGTICVPQKKICDGITDCIDEADENECNPINYGSDLILNKYQNRSVETQYNWEQKMQSENLTEEEMSSAYITNCGKLTSSLEKLFNI